MAISVWVKNFVENNNGKYTDNDKTSPEYSHTVGVSPNN